MKVVTGAFQALRLGPKVTPTRRSMAPPHRRLLMPLFQSHSVSGCTDSTVKSSRTPLASPTAAAAAPARRTAAAPRNRACVSSSNCMAAATAVFHRVATLVGFRSFRLPHGPPKQQPLAGANVAGGGGSVSRSSKVKERKAVNASSPPSSPYRSAQMHFPFGLGIYGAAGLHAVDEPMLSFPSPTSGIFPPILMRHNPFFWKPAEAQLDPRAGLAVGLAACTS
ncbi:hypothetical protein Esti_001696 [Eimeria stiedai]